MEKISGYQLRKCSDVEMEYPYMEVLDQNGTVFMDISMSDDGELRVLFYPGIASKWIDLRSLEDIINKAKGKLT